MNHAEIRDQFLLNGSASPSAKLAHLEHVFEGYSHRVEGGEEDNPYPSDSNRGASWARGYAEAVWAIAPANVRVRWCVFARFGAAACGACEQCSVAKSPAWSGRGYHGGSE